MGDDKIDVRKNEVFSRAVRAGKRTYFFDVKETKSGELYLIITESKKNGTGPEAVFEKHKIFLYKEDFDKFFSGFQEACNYIYTENEGAEENLCLETPAVTV
jgi:hypothetical protein